MLRTGLLIKILKRICNISFLNSHIQNQFKKNAKCQCTKLEKKKIAIPVQKTSGSHIDQLTSKMTFYIFPYIYMRDDLRCTWFGARPQLPLAPADHLSPPLTAPLHKFGKSRLSPPVFIKMRSGEYRQHYLLLHCIQWPGI